jgi:hypothetical protein
MNEEEKQRGLELQAYIDSIRDMTIKEIATKHLKKHHLPKFLAGLLVKFSVPLLMAKDYELTELEKENVGLKLKLEALEGQTPWKDIKNKSEVIGKLTKAKELLKWALHSDPEHDEDFEKKWSEAEQFLKDSEVEI